MRKFFTLAFSLALALVAAAEGGEQPAPARRLPPGGLLARQRQARSVHLVMDPIAPDAEAVEGTVCVTETQTNSYFAIVCCDNAYCGIQDLGEYRIFIFSVWDPGDPMDLTAREGDTPEEKRARILYCAEGTEATRFGGEGTGAKTMTLFPWQVGENVSARIEAEKDGEDRTAYTCFVRKGASGEWRKIATVSTLSRNGAVRGVYSFVEDFWRNFTSAKLTRRAVFSGYRSRARGSSEWVDVKRALFSADSTKAFNIDAGLLAEGTFFLATGGDVKMEHAELWKVIE